MFYTIFSLDITLIIIVAAISFAACSIEGMTGFGSAILALPFLLLYLDMGDAVVMVICHSFIVSGIVLVRNIRLVNGKILLKILILAGLGLPLGLVMYIWLPEYILKILLSLFMIIIGINGLIKINSNNINPDNNNEVKQKNKWFDTIKNILLLFSGGIMQGSFGVGGPLIVIYASGAIQKKGEFRATMSTVWVVLNAILILKFLITGAFVKSVIPAVLPVTIPFVIVGFIIGNYLHHRVSEVVFKKVVYGALAVIGTIFCISTLSSFIL